MSHGNNVYMYACKGAYPLAGSGITDVKRFSGYERQFPLADNCLGGYFSNYPIQPERWLPIVHGYESATTPFAPTTGGFQLHRIFRDITSAEATAGITLYRGAFFKVLTAGTWAVYISKALSGSGATLTVGAETVLTAESNSYVQRIATEQSVPSGVVFSSPSSGSPLSFGSLAANALVFLWMKVVFSAGAGAAMYDIFDLTFTLGGVADTEFHYYHTVQSAVTTVTVSGARDGEIVTLPQGETYTITTTNSSGGVTDPPSSTVIMTAAGSMVSPHLQQAITGQRIAGQWIAPCNKTGTGVYTVQFRPPVPGHYHLTFDCGGQLFATRSVEVSPVV